MNPRAIYLTPWGIPATLRPIELRMDPPVSDSKRASMLHDVASSECWR